MSVEQIRKLGDVVSRLLTDFGIKSANLACVAEQQE